MKEFLNFLYFARVIVQNKTDFSDTFCGRQTGKDYLTSSTTYGLINENEKNRFSPAVGIYTYI